MTPDEFAPPEAFRIVRYSPKFAPWTDEDVAIFLRSNRMCIVDNIMRMTAHDERDAQVMLDNERRGVVMTPVERITLDELE